MSLDYPIYIAGLSAILGIIGTVAAERLLDSLRLKDSKAAIIQENLMLKKENLRLQLLVDTLQTAVDEQRLNLAVYEDGQRIIAEYEFQESNGTYFDRSKNLHFCPTCLSKSPPVRSPMNDNGDGWQCQCGQWCPDFQRLGLGKRDT